MCSKVCVCVCALVQVEGTSRRMTLMNGKGRRDQKGAKEEDNPVDVERMKKMAVQDRKARRKKNKVQ